MPKKKLFKKNGFRRRNKKKACPSNQYIYTYEIVDLNVIFLSQTDIQHTNFRKQQVMRLPNKAVDVRENITGLPQHIACAYKHCI